MRKFRFIGTEQQALDYVIDPQNAPVFGEVYAGDKVFGTEHSIIDFIETIQELALEWEEIL